MRTAIEWFEKYLEVEYDPELAQKVKLFKHLESDGFCDADDEDYDDDLPEGYDDMMGVFGRLLETPEILALKEAEKEEARRREEEARKAAELQKNREKNERNAYYEAMKNWRKATEKSEAERKKEQERRWKARKTS